MENKFEWRDSNGQKYLFVEAQNHHELGRGVGQGLKEQIGFGLTVNRRNMEKMKAEGRYEEAMELAKQYTALIPEVYMDEIAGITEGFNKATGENVGIDEIAYQTFSNDIGHKMRASAINRAQALDGCTNFGAINPDGTIVHGQNHDTAHAQAPLFAFVHQVLPDEEAFIFRPGACIANVMSKNAAGVTMTVSVVITNAEADVMTPRAVLVREALKQTTAIGAARCLVDEKGRSPFSFNTVISDHKTIVGTQQIPSEQRIVQVKRWIAQSNTYDYADWQDVLIRKGYSKRRQWYAEDLISTYQARLGILHDYDILQILADEPIIWRNKLADGIGSTELFMTRESFGIGNTSESPIGKIPF